ncbi:NUDIX hydrolase [Acetobacterium woodii]|uniref:ADP-ribose pyrophosphatase NudF n=1 Tax=Acetobacterium woodii (strain ATCC 29683 / DSM 1030 / JCM 2381 / KCTC 1655 / WB1) TaxID=931626 RepID=H6LCH2_ACEWD|nr:NUDIX hydrolase [Acetobacterium woodii]AFA47754.1 ADP-ribose pyrophosphatase NudF [Acetobacterium woodii DSM 1030]
MKQFEKTINSKMIYDGRIVKLRVDEVELPDGSYSKREVISHQGAVGVLCIKDGQMIFVKQYRIASQQLLTEIPAGILESGEDPEKAAIRECQEEIGFRPLNLFKLGDFIPTPGYCSERITLFCATEFIWDPLEEDPNEFIKVVKIPLKTVRALFINGHFIDGKTVAALGYYFSIAAREYFVE